MARLVWLMGTLALVGCRGVSGGEESTKAESLASESTDSSSTTTSTTSSPTDTEPGPTTTLGYEPDPDVQTWVPEDWPFAEPPARIIFFGDSITDGQGTSRNGSSYVELLLDNDDERYPAYEGLDLYTWFGEIQAYDASVGGATTETVMSFQLPWLEEALGEQVDGPTLVVGTIGGNDVTEVIFGLRQLEDESERIATNVDQIAAFFQDPGRFPDGSMVYMTNIYEPTDAVGQADQCFFGLDLTGIQEPFDALNARTLELAQDSGWAWVDLRGHFLGHGFNNDDEDSPHYDESDPTRWLARDCIHPNDRGHHEIRRLFLSAIDNRPLPK